MTEQTADFIATKHKTSSGHFSRYYLKKMFIFIRQVLKDSYCTKEISEKKTLLKMAELRLSGFIRQEDPTFSQKRRDLERLKRYLFQASSSGDSAYKAEIIMDELSDHYNLSSLPFIRLKKQPRRINHHRYEEQQVAS